MDTKPIKTMFVRTMYIMVILAVVFSASTAAYAAPSSPFLGHWEATDVDGSNMGLSIGGRPTGPFQITWTDDYISFCGGEAGIVRGTGWLYEGDPNLLEADVHLECFTTGETLDFHVTFRYHPTTNTLSTRYDFGDVTIWHRPGGGQAEEPLAALGLRVNYGHDWVESFYEADHTVWLSVTDGDGNLRATAELFTEPKDFWGGETGFQTSDSDWFDSEGIQMEYPPDIQPYDWVYGWVDNGASAQVQIGEIQGAIDLETDSIRGTVLADWFAEELYIICDPWGLSDISQYRESSVYPDGVNEYDCSWSGVLDFELGQELGVWYYGSDGHAVVNAFSTSEARIHASVTGDFFFATDFNPGTLSISIYESAREDAVLLWSDEVDTDESGFVHIGPDVHGLDLMPGNYLVISDGRILKGLVLDLISLDVFDTEHDIMAGTAPAGREVTVVAAPGPEWEVQTILNVLADPETGAWLADFSPIEFDITEEMRGWSFASISDEDGDTNETSSLPAPPNPHFTVFPEWEWFDGYDWPDGAIVTITVANKPECQATGESWGGFFNGGFPGDCDIAVGDVVTFTDGETSRTHTVQNLAITNVDKEANTVAGTADEGVLVYAWVHEYGYDMELQIEEGTWLANFGSAGLDLAENMGGRVEVRDQFGNGTAVDWWIPNPHFTIFPLWQWYDGLDWPDEAIITITIEGKPQCTAVKESWNYFFNGGFPADCNIIEAGDTVVFTDGTTTRTHTVRNLTITAIDLNAETISGIADAGATVYVWPHDGWFEPLEAVADVSGVWQVDLDDAGYDIQEGASGRAEIRDDMGNATAVDWSLNPHIIVHTTDDWFRAEGFMPNTSLDFWLYDSLGGNPRLESTTAQTDSSGTVTHWVGDQMDIVPGNYVVVSDGTSTRDVVLEALTFDVFDITQGILQGTAPEPFGRTVSVGIGCWQRDDLTMDVTTDNSGVWVADFDAPVPDDFGCVFAWAYDGDGDSSESRPEQIISLGE